MGEKIFISYSHKQGEWVWKNWVPCLCAGGAEVLIDRNRFVAGKAVVGQMDATQDAADMNVLVLSPDYLASAYCLHEMDRAVKHDPKFKKGVIVPVKRVDCQLPNKIKIPNPLYVNLCDDKDVREWDSLLHACKADLGTSAPEWFNTRDAIVRYLQRGQSVNLVVTHKPKWRELIEHLQKDHFSELGIVDLQNPLTASRRGLVVEMLKACGSATSVPHEPEDLVTLGQVFEGRLIPSQIALIDFDMVAHRKQYEVDFFASLRYSIMENRKLILLIHSRSHFIELLPADHPLSSINIHTVELKGRP